MQVGSEIFHYASEKAVDLLGDGYEGLEVVKEDDGDYSMKVYYNKDGCKKIIKMDNELLENCSIKLFVLRADKCFPERHCKDLYDCIVEKVDELYRESKGQYKGLVLKRGSYNFSVTYEENIVKFEGN